MSKLPPYPRQDVQNFPPSFQEWLRQLQQSLTSGSGSIPWSSIDKAGSNLAELTTRPWAALDKGGSNLTDIITRLHSSLQSIQGGSGGNAFHMSQNDYHSFGSENLNRIATSGTFPQTATSPGYIIADATAGNITIQLPTLSSGGSPTATIGRRFQIKRYDNTANIVTISRQGTDLFENGATSYSLGAQNHSITLYGWFNAAWPNGIWFIEALETNQFATITHDFPSIAAGATGTITVAVTGAAVNDIVSIGLPAIVDAGLVYSAHVTSAGTVTFRAFNPTAAAIDPPSRIYKFLVTKAP